MQFSRKKVPILEIDNPMFNISEGLAKYINSSNFAQSSIGELIGLNKINGKQLSGLAVGTVILYGPDIMKSLQGKISTDQLLKNSVTTAVAGATATLGNTIMPVIGGFVGGAVGGFVVKKLLDQYIEDDAKKMFRILKEEFIDEVTLAGLNKEEYQEVTQFTVCSSDISKLLENMYESGEPRRFAREAIVGAAIIEVISKRKKITAQDFYSGLAMVATT